MKGPRRTPPGLLALVALAGSAAAALPWIIDFDALRAGSGVTTLGDVDFSLDAPDVDLVVSTGLSATSEPNYLGAAGGGSDPFLPGDVIRLAFASPVVELSLAVLSTAGAPLGAFELTTPGGSDVSGMPDSTLEGDEVHRLSVVSATPFSSAELRTAPEQLYAFHVDDVAYTVPEPRAAAWLAFALLAMRARRAPHRT